MFMSPYSRDEREGGGGGFTWPAKAGIGVAVDGRATCGPRPGREGGGGRAGGSAASFLFKQWTVQAMNSVRAIPLFKQ